VSEVRSYHGQPVLKEPTWTWEIPCYFFTGGLAGASAGVAYLCELRGDADGARRAWTTALAGISVSPLLLISDLGRPSRFLNMLRMVKVTSPMSIGSWILSASGTATAIAAANAWLGLFPRLAGAARPVAALAGLPLSSYTAALVTNTAVPVWHEARSTLPFVFVAGAGVSAGGALLLITPVPEGGAARRLALAGAVAEIALTEAMKRGLGEHGQAYESGSAHRFDRAASALLAAGAGLVAARGRRSRAASALAGGLLLAGALSTRWSVYRAGFNSAADPAAVIRPQRERIRRGLTRGAAQRVARSAA
jgi:formate-dependent nitrite reductase membrane component NrfD